MTVVEVKISIPLTLNLSSQHVLSIQFLGLRLGLVINRELEMKFRIHPKSSLLDWIRLPHRSR